MVRGDPRGLCEGRHDMNDTRRFVAIALILLVALYVLFLTVAHRTETVTIGVEFPPKDQSRLAPPPIIRKDVSHSWQTWKVAL